MKLKKLKVLLAIFLPVQILLLQLAERNPHFIEKYYSNGLYPFISSSLRFLFGWIPFSLGDLLLALLLFLLLRFLFGLIKNKFKNFIPKIVQFTAVLSLLYFCFYFFWGLNYYREPLTTNLQLKSTKYTTAQLVSLSKKIIKKTNELQMLITNSDTLQVTVPYNQQVIYEKAPQGFKNISKKYSQFNYGNSAVKSSLMSLLQSYNGTAGYMNPLTGEAQVNDKIPLTGYASTTCHEMAHQLGWAAENEANFVGFLASIANDDLYFQYSGYSMATRYLILEIYKRDKEQFKEVYASIHTGIIKDFKARTNFWKSYKNPFEPLIKKGYNAYLKVNNQDKGIESYHYVVDLLIGYFEENQLL
jgi:hypothetical protein